MIDCPPPHSTATTPNTTTTTTAAAAPMSGNGPTEGLDFIETEEDVRAVEAATLKIQSTFRGKKIRSKFGGQKQADEASGKQSETGQLDSEATLEDRSSKEQSDRAASELSDKVAEMQVNDNKSSSSSSQQKGAPDNVSITFRSAGGSPRSQPSRRLAVFNFGRLSMNFRCHSHGSVLVR